MDNRFFLIDQHAAHERTLFDHFRKSPVRKQCLLLPLEFELSRANEEFLEENRKTIEDAGIELRKKRAGQWEIEAVPDFAATLAEDIADFLQGDVTEFPDPSHEIFAVMACRAAVKEGDRLDSITAQNIIMQAFALKHARCPHGRPVWIEFSRHDLYQMIGRS